MKRQVTLRALSLLLFFLALQTSWAQSFTNGDFQFSITDHTNEVASVSKSNFIEEVGEASLHSTNPVRSIHVSTAGDISKIISVNEQNIITHLTISGYLNGTDIAILRRMAGGHFDVFDMAHYPGKPGVLQVLDLSKATIVAGGNPYFMMSDIQDWYYDQYYGTSNNTVGTYMFAYCNKLVSITLPDNAITIGSLALFGCLSLEKVMIGENMKRMENMPFTHSEKLSEIHINAPIPPTVSDPNYGWDFSATLYVIDNNAKRNYETAILWKNFNTIRYHNLVVAPDQHLTIDSDNYRDIILNASGDNKGQLQTSSLFSNNPALTVSGAVEVRYTLKGQVWYFIGLPFDVASITVNGAAASQGRNIAISEYNTQKRADEGASGGASNHFSTIELSEMKMGKGVILSLPTNSEVVFRASADTKSNVVSTSDHSVPVVATSTSKGAAHQGWNLVSNPYPTHLLPAWSSVAGVYVDDHKGGYDFIVNGGDVLIAPFIAYFVQVAGVEELDYLASWRRAPHAATQMVLAAESGSFQLTARNAQGADKLYFNESERAAAAYTIGVDVAKMYSGNSQAPVLTAKLGIDQLVCRGVNPQILTEGVAVELKSTTTGSVELSLSGTPQGAASLWLEDEKGNRIDLLEGATSIETKAGVTTRFTLRSEMLPTSVEGVEGVVTVIATSNGITIDNLQGGERVEIISLAGQLLESNLIWATSHRVALQSGVYLVRVDGTVHKVSVK